MTAARLPLKYGLNPHQAAAHAAAADGRPLPFAVVNGTPSVVNLLDALQGWRLVRELAAALGRPAAASIKHVSPAGAAVAGPVDDVVRTAFDVRERLSPVASAYARARDGDPRASYGDMVAVSHPVDGDLAALLRGVVSDGVIAPGFEPGTAGILAGKKSGAFLALEVDPAYVPPDEEVRDVFGVRITQQRDRLEISSDDLGEAVVGVLDPAGVDDAVLGLIVARHVQSNAVCLASGGRAIGTAGGQQARVECIRLAGARADRWRMRRHPRLAGLPFRDGVPRQARLNAAVRLAEGHLDASEQGALADLIAGPVPVLDDAERARWLADCPPATLASDAYLPFADNVDAAAAHGVACIVEGGGSVRGADVEQACRARGIALVRTGLRLFAH